MPHIHLSRELLREVALGRLPARKLVELGLEHLRGICPACAEELQAWQREAGSPWRSAERAFRIVPALLAHQLPRMLLQAQEAQRELVALLALSPEERLVKVRRARRRFRSQALLLLLLEESRRNILLSPIEALHFADLSVEVASRLARADSAPDLLVLAFAARLNALRVRGDLESAGRTLKLARSLAHFEGVTNPGVLAYLDSVEASLRRDQGRGDAAEPLLERAITLYSMVGDSLEIARVRLQRSVLFGQTGRWDRSLEAARSVLQGIDKVADPQLYYWARFNIAVCLVRKRQFEEASAILDPDEHEHRAEREPLFHVRYLWLRGHSAALQGKPKRARLVLAKAFETFSEAGANLDADLVARELAVL